MAAVNCCCCTPCPDKNMMSRILIVGFLLVSTLSFGQNQAEKDSLINEMCKTIKTSKDLPDSIRVAGAFEEHLYPYLEGFPESQRKDIWTAIFYRFQVRCEEFKEILDRLDPPSGDWKRLTEKPGTNLSKKVCKQFLDHKKYSYRESTGDTVHFEIKNGLWKERFKDGTFSKLKFHWVNNCEFDLEFIESDNESRKNLSKPGDKYRYQITDKKEGYYDMTVQVLGTERYYMFKVYY